MDERPIILFDGVCNFCNSAVNFIIKRNTKRNILFAPLQSDAGRALLLQNNLSLNDMRSFIFMEKGKVFERSGASLRVCRHLNALWPLCYGFMIVPRFIRDGIYNWMARNRFKWFGSRTECMVPSAEIKARFIS